MLRLSLLIALVSSILDFSYCHAQDVGVGVMAGNLTQFKGSSSVDLATGIMNYNIPLLNVQQDGYEIPVSLNYTASGIKLGTKNDIAGKGWSLNYGAGIVSRNMRGGFADEYKERGILFNPIPPADQSTYSAHQAKVETGKIDGESDIFTVNIQGSTIRFILSLEAGKLKANPIERTDVQIECIFNSFSYDITGFKITDTQGNVYTFEAASPTSSYLKDPVPGSSKIMYGRISWYLTKISLVNDGDIRFEYTNDFLERINSIRGECYLRYGSAKLFPKLNNDPALNAQLNALSNSNIGYAINAIREQIIAGNMRLNSLGMAVEMDQLSDTTVFSRMNQILWDDQVDKLNKLVQQNGQLVFEQKLNNSLIHNVLDQMYNSNDQIKSEFESSESETLFPNKLIKRIVTRTGIIEFSYHEQAGSGKVNDFLIEKIEHKTITGELLRTYVFDINRSGFLKKIQAFTPASKLEQLYDLGYYLEDIVGTETLEPNGMSRDYWGYYNGKLNFTPFVSHLGQYDSSFPNGLPVFAPDLHLRSKEYTDDVLARLTGAPGGPVLADRNPVDSAAVWGTLKKISNTLGGSVSFKYEGNEICAPTGKANFAIGGIRIKSITTNDGQKDQTVSYKYRFPSQDNASFLKSTGLLTEWGKKTFGIPYNSASGTDIQIYSDYVDLSTRYVDNSNNGVLYHYVEEVRSDGAGTGYSYLPALPGYNNEHESFDFLFHKLPLMKIDYNSAGKIIRIKKNTYQINCSSSAYESMLPWPQGGSVKSFPQLKKGLISYDEENLKKSYSNSLSNQITFDGTTYSINPYYRLYVPNYEERVKTQQLPVSYSLTTGYAASLKEEETDVYDMDYNLASIGAGNSSDRLALSYLLLSASDIKPVRSVVTYVYGNPAHLNPTEISTKSSNGDILSKKIKYSIDYQLAAQHPVSLLKIQGRQTEVIEEQQWLSKDAGTTFKLISGTINTYNSRVVKGKTYLLPEKVYRLNLTTPIAPGAAGYTQTVSSNAPFNTVFWENNQLYDVPFLTKIWDDGVSFFRNSGIKDRTGKNVKAVKYDPFNADLLVEATLADPKNILAVDFSPYRKHKYYEKYKLFLNEYFPPAEKQKVRFSEAPILNSRDIAVNMDQRFYAAGIDSAMINLQVNFPQVYFTYAYKPAFQALKKLAITMAYGNDQNAFIKAYVAYKKAKFLMGDAEFIKMTNALTASDFNYLEVNAYFDLLGQLFYADFDLYDRMFNPESSILPMVKQDLTNLHIPLAVDVDNLIAGNVNLDLFLSGMGGLEKKYTYRIIYKNNSYSQPVTRSFPTNNDRISKDKLILSTLTNASEVKSIEFLFGYDQYFSNMGLFIAVPDYVQFKATGYLPDHTPYISFDQNLRYTETFYDGKMNRHFVKDLNNAVVQVEEKNYIKKEVELPKKTPVVISNTYAEYAANQCNIISITFVNSTTAEIIKKDSMIIPGHHSSFEVPAGKYNIYVDADGPIGKVRFGSQEITTSNVGTVATDTLIAAQGYTINVGP